MNTPGIWSLPVRTFERIALAGAVMLLLSAPAFSQQPPSAQAAGEYATVVGFIGSDRLLVQDDAGGRSWIQYIGVRGPLSSSPLNAEAAASHGPLVMGQRVRLEPDGLDRNDRYRFRHVFLGDESVPIAAQLVTAGWARAVPIPIDHRFRSLYLQLQEQAIVSQSGLWRAGIFGPATPWRPAGSSGAGYVAADPRLQRHLERLGTVPTGARVLARLLQLAPVIKATPIDEGVYGAAEHLGLTSIVNAALLDADSADLATVIGHEGNHLIDFAANASGATSFDCFTIEVRAFTIGAQIWSEFFGPGGKANPSNSLERANNRNLAALQGGELDYHVRLSTGYQAQCAGRFERD